MEFQFKLTFKRSTSIIAEITGITIPADLLTVEEVGNKIIETEQLLEKLTGYRVHIDQVR